MENRKARLRPAAFASAALLLTLLISSCGGSSDPAAPANNPDQARTPAADDLMKGHHLWGYWNCYIPPSNDTIEFLPLRAGAFHLNARRFLEDTACTNCLKLVSLDKDLVNMVIVAQIEITHPFSGLARFTGFDVRGIVISDGSLYFPTLDARLPDASQGDFTLLNPDGWTRLWNSSEFPPGSGPYPILEYSPGKFATGTSFTATVNPYIEFTQDPRSSFPAGASITREYRLTLKPGGAFFGYAVDACWEPPLVDPPVDLMTDFPESANAMEPYVLSTYLDQPLKDQVGDTASLALEMADRQLFGLPSIAYVECPDLFTGLVEPQIWGIGPGGPLWNWVFTSFDIANETGAPAGEYPALIKVEDSLQDPYLGYINHRYELTYLEVKTYVPPDFSGLAVFTAPGPPGSSGEPGAPNMFLLDLDTMWESQITKYVGIGANFEEPRINAQGTLALLTFCPSPVTSHLEVFEIGTPNSWLDFPPAGYYGHADFHPDGEHIVLAVGTGWGNTPDLVTMKYDGSEWTKIATAPGSVSYPKWSPDGTRIAMVIGPAGPPPPQSALWIYDTTTQEFTQLLSGQYLIQCPSWNPAQPDGQDWIAFQSTMNDPMGFWSDIYVINPDTLEMSLLVDTGMDDRHPSFSPDGKSVMFASDGFMGSDLYVYAIQSAEIFQITTDDTFDDAPCWSWGW